jgi:hypothetical protein
MPSMMRNVVDPDFWEILDLNGRSITWQRLDPKPDRKTQSLSAWEHIHGWIWLKNCANSQFVNFGSPLVHLTREHISFNKSVDLSLIAARSINSRIHDVIHGRSREWICECILFHAVEIRNEILLPVAWKSQFRQNLTVAYAIERILPELLTLGDHNHSHNQFVDSDPLISGSSRSPKGISASQRDVCWLTHAMGSSFFVSASAHDFIRDLTSFQEPTSPRAWIHRPDPTHPPSCYACHLGIGLRCHMQMAFTLTAQNCPSSIRLETPTVCPSIYSLFLNLDRHAS